MKEADGDRPPDAELDRTRRRSSIKASSPLQRRQRRREMDVAPLIEQLQKICRAGDEKPRRFHAGGLLVVIAIIAVLAVMGIRLISA